jgi:hypothetical protein
MAAAAIALASQMVEGFARRLTGAVTRKAAGRLGGSISATATGAAMSFASTYALGNLAQPYYGAGRTLDVPTLKAKPAAPRAGQDAGGAIRVRKLWSKAVSFRTPVCAAL